MSKQKEVETYVTSRGVTVEIIGISPFEVDDLLKSMPLPEVPTRTVQTDLPGYSEVEELSAEDLRNDEERAAWTRYVKERDEIQRKRNEVATDYAFLEGTRFPMDGLEEWKAKRRRWNLPVPEDELELKKLYFRTHIIGGADDLSALIRKIQGRTGVDEATLKQVQATFQH